MLQTSGEFQHLQAAHCESGVTSNLLLNAGFPVSEKMAFGVGSGLFFVHLPFLKVMGLPLTSYRTYPGSIFKKTCSRLKIPFEYLKFRNQIEGARELDKKANQNQAVGLRTNIYWLPYIPEGFRFQFNAHNMVVYGKTSDNEFKVSDPVMETATLCLSKDLLRARYSKGPLAPYGLMFFPKEKLKNELSSQVLEKAVLSGIRETVYGMLYTPMPFAGIKGMRFLSRRISKWPAKFKNSETLKLHLSNIVRMQEEIGTGGAGFRLLYAAFLQEAGEGFQNQALLQASRDMCEAANLWREFATLIVQFCKDRPQSSFDQIPKTLIKIADCEKKVYQDLRRNYL